MVAVSYKREYNLKLIELLRETVDAHPSLSFSQILETYGFITIDCGFNIEQTALVNYWSNEFYLRSEDLYHRVKSKMPDND